VANSFRDEYIDLLEKFGTEFDRRYIFEAAAVTVVSFFRIWRS
jgi:hypothetical protein